MSLDLDALADLRSEAMAERDAMVAERDALAEKIDRFDRAVVVFDQGLELLGGGEPDVPPAPKATPPGSSNGSQRPASSGPVCDVCGHKAKNANGLKIHKGRSHGTSKPVRETPPRPKGAAGGTPVSQVCDGCNQSFPTPAALLHHLRSCEASE